ncbi:MAG TPA: hypothetical protein VNK91_07060, partial [Burkholderiaceae bacterium]|nr:hypothetical protein [Burkholderiaceae bacterium]
MKSLAALLCLALSAAGGGAAAVPFAERFAPGRIVTAEQVEQALAAARVENERVEAHYQAALAKCAGEFLQNRCR